MMGQSFWRYFILSTEEFAFCDIEKKEFETVVIDCFNVFFQLMLGKRHGNCTYKSLHLYIHIDQF